LQLIAAKTGDRGNQRGGCCPGRTGNYWRIFNPKNGRLFGLAQLAVNALQAYGLLRDQVKESIAAANASQLALSGLQSTAAAFGTDALKAQDAAKRLSTDGLLTVTESANGLKNLLSSGLNLEQANQLMDVYKDRAAFGRQNTIQYGQAVQNLAESFKTQSSMIGNLSGMTENYNQIIQVGAGEMGKQVSQLRAAELAQAKYLGTLKLSNGSIGDAARFSDTAAGAQARLATATQNAQIMFGEALQPAVQELNKGFLNS
jgi:NADH/NAD ratio-sensing transcriptional regulator Rex